MDDEIIYNGKRFTRFGNYYRSSRKFLHRAIWEDANGPIPKGYHVHHKDHDRSNNSLGNLELVHGRQHLSKHHKGHSRRPDAALAAHPAWRASEAGQKFMSEMGHRNQHYLRQEVAFVCECCRANFQAQPKGTNRFCSPACKSKQRRLDGKDNVPATCQQCSAAFMANRFRPAACCCLGCSRKLWLSTLDGRAHLERLAAAKRLK